MSEKQGKVKILSSGVTAEIITVTETEFTHMARDLREPWPRCLIIHSMTARESLICNEYDM